MGKQKKDGGLGFRDIEGFNLSLLGKQLWRLSTNESSLLARVLKGKYYPFCSPLEASLGTRPSYGWRSIHSSQDLMKQGMRKEMGNGTSLHLLQDPWLPTDPPRPPNPRPAFDPLSYNLQYYKDPYSDQWNLSRILEGFSKEEAELMLKIKPGGITSSANYSWIHNKSGAYTVKSGYWIWRTRLKDKQENEQVLNPNIQPLLEEIWKIKAPPKIKHFLWRCISNCLAVGINMKRKRLTKNEDCSRCFEKAETVNHLLFQCPFARVVWALSPLGHLFSPLPSPSILENLGNLLLPQYLKKGVQEEKDRFKNWPWIVWFIWKRRNDFTFSGMDWAPDEVLTQAWEAAEDWLSATSNLVRSPSPRLSVSRDRKWKPPDRNHLKCNIDGSWLNGSNKSGIAWILRDHWGHIKHFGAKCFPGLLSPLQTEATALVWAVSCLSTQGYKEVHFESDCQNLIKAILHPREWPCLQSFTSEINSFKSEECKFSFGFSNRECNGCADAMAKHITHCPIYFAILDVTPPSWLQHFVDLDIPFGNE